MNIVFVIPTLTGGGAERIITNLANGLALEGNRISIFTFEQGRVFYELSHNIDVICAGFIINRKNRFRAILSNALHLSREIAFLYRNINSKNPDVIISFLPIADIAVHIATKYLCKNKIPVVYSERNDPWHRNRMLQFLLSHIYVQSDFFVCQGDNVYEYYSNIPKEKKIIIPNGLDVYKLPKPIPRVNNYEIISIGRLCRQKNFELLINSFCNIFNSLPSQSTLTIYGEGPDRKRLEHIIAEKGMGNHIFLPGAIKNVWDIAKGASLFVMSSNYEGFPNALLEAMAMGIPVVSTDFNTGIAREIVLPCDGIVVPINNECELAKSIFKIIRQDYHKYNVDYQMIREKYNIDYICSKWISLLKRIER